MNTNENKDSPNRNEMLTGINIEPAFLHPAVAKPIELYSHWLGRLEKQGDFLHATLSQGVTIQRWLIVGLAALVYAFLTIETNAVGEIVILIAIIINTISIIHAAGSFARMQSQQELWQTFFTVKLWQLEDHIFLDRSAGLGASIERFGDANIKKLFDNHPKHKRAEEVIKLIRSDNSQQLKFAIDDDVFLNIRSSIGFIETIFYPTLILELIFLFTFVRRNSVELLEQINRLT